MRLAQGLVSAQPPQDSRSAPGRRLRRRRSSSSCSATETTVTWSVDSESKKGVPQAIFEWTELMKANGLAKQPPNHLWLMQDTMAPLQDTIGMIALTAQGTPTYNVPMDGWSRAALGIAESGVEQGFITNMVGRLDKSYLMLGYVAVASTPGTERALFGLGAGGDHRYVGVTMAPRFKGTGANMMGTVGMVNPMTDVHPVVLKLAPAQMEYVVYTDQEKITVTWKAVTSPDNLLVFGNAGFGGTANARYLYGALWTGPEADFADLDVKRMLVGLGWTVSGW